MDITEDIESILYIAREVSVYKIPPRITNEGYRANDWGDLAAPLWKGRLRIIENTKGVALHLEDSQTGAGRSLIVIQSTNLRDIRGRRGLAEYDPGKPSVEAVLDSSRYFVIRVEDAGKRAYIGMGFAERSDSFDFNVALQDYTKRHRALLNPVTDSAQPSPHIPAGPKKDYSLKEGQTFSISIPGHAKSMTENNFIGSSSESTASSSGSSGIPLLPPPPGAPRKR